MTPQRRTNRVFLIGAGTSIQAPASIPAAAALSSLIVRSVAPTPRVGHAMLQLLSSSDDRRRKLSPIRFEQLVEVVQENLDERLSLFDFLRCSRQPNELHLRVARATCTGDVLFTTNFDCFLEEAILSLGFEPESVASERQFAVWNGRRNKARIPVFKLHGTVDRYSGHRRTPATETLGATIKSITRNAKQPLLPPAKRSMFLSRLENADLYVLGYSGSDDLDIIPTLRLAKPRSITWVAHDSQAAQPRDATQELKAELGQTPPAQFSDRETLFAHWLLREGVLRYVRANTLEFLRTCTPDVSTIAANERENVAKMIHSHFGQWRSAHAADMFTRYAFAGELFFRAFRYRAAVRCHRLARRLGAPRGGGARWALSFARVCVDRADYDQAVQVLSRLRAASCPPAIRARLIHDRGFIAYKRRDFAGAERHFQHALSLRGHIDADVLCALHHDFGVLRQEQTRYREASEFFRVAVKHARAAGIPNRVGWGTFHLGTVNYYLARLRTADRQHRASLATARSIPDLNQCNNSLHGLALIEFLAGNLRVAVANCRECLRLAAQTGQKEWTGMDWQHLGVSLLEKRWLNAADECFKRADRLYRRVGDFETRAELLCYRAIAGLARRDRRAAFRCSAKAVSVAQHRRATEFYSRALAIHGLACAACNKPGWRRLISRGIELSRKIPVIKLELIHDLVHWGDEPVRAVISRAERQWAYRRYREIGNARRAAVLVA